MHFIRALEILGLLFAGGVATSFAEYKFQYSLFMTIAQLFGKKF
jgi:hypothetical protein